MFKFNCRHGEHETVAEARACAASSQTSPAQERPEWATRLERAHTSNPRTASTTEVPEGHYAVDFEGQLRFFKVDRPAEGKWKGYVFVREQASDDLWPVKNPTRRMAILAKIGQSVEEAGKRYGREIGRCYKCHRTLTDPLSRQLGIGPDCRSK